MREMTENEREELDYKLEILCNLPGEKPCVAITYFVSNGKKEGGAFRTIHGQLKRIDFYKREIIMKDSSCIQMDCILELNGE